MPTQVVVHFYPKNANPQFVQWCHRNMDATRRLGIRMQFCVASDRTIKKFKNKGITQWPVMVHGQEAIYPAKAIQDWFDAKMQPQQQQAASRIAQQQEEVRGVGLNPYTGEIDEEELEKAQQAEHAAIMMEPDENTETTDKDIDRQRAQRMRDIAHRRGDRSGGPKPVQSGGSSGTPGCKVNAKKAQSAEDIAAAEALRGGDDEDNKFDRMVLEKNGSGGASDVNDEDQLKDYARSLMDSIEVGN
jgi:hypothetical protein